MNNIKKYFEFSGTINGTNYVLRNLLATLVAFIGGFSIGFGIGGEMQALTLVGIALIVPALWFNACSIYKRSLALFPEYAVWITVSMFLLQILDTYNTVFGVIALITGLVLVFKNSDIEEHNG
jgi:uncharacterized membrane protein YhaH (DUF805 family)